MNINVNFKEPNKRELDILVEKLRARYGSSNYSVAIRYAVRQAVLFFDLDYPLSDNPVKNQSAAK